MVKLKKELNSHNVFYYIAAFFVIIVLSISVLGGYLYHFYYQTVYADFQKGNEQQLSVILNLHENDMRIVDDIVMQMSLSDDVTRFVLKDQPQKAIKLEEHLKRYSAVSQFFNLILYQYHGDEYLYSDSTSIGTDYFCREGCIMEETAADRVRELLLEPTSQLHILPEQESSGIWINYYLANKNKVVLFRGIPPECDGTLVFMIPDTYYNKLLGSAPEEKRRNFLYYDGQMIISRGSAEASDEELGSLLSEGFEGTRRVQLDHGQFLLSVAEGDSGILYGSLQSMDIFFDKFVSSQWGIIWVVLVCAIPAAFAIVIVSGRIVRKVRHLNLLLNDEANSDLRSIENGIETLVASQKESEKESLLLKKTRFIRDFIRGSFADRGETLLAARTAGLEVDYGLYLVVLIRSRELNNENKAYSRMLKSIQEEEKVEGYGIHLISNNQNLFVLFADEQAEVEAALQKLLEIEEEYGQEYVVAASNYHSNFSESSKAYLEANTAFDNHLLLDNSQIIRFGEAAQIDYASLLTENYLHRLRYAIRAGDRESMEMAVKDICQRMKRENASLYAFRILYNDILHVLLSEWKGAQSKLNDFYNVFTLSQCLNIQDFYGLLCDACNSIIDQREGILTENSDITQTAIAYMQENFQDPELTMNALAEYLHISSVTLAVEFKNEMDVRPSDYLANLRMEKAKELLRNTNMLVREISLAVGYEDAHVFMRRFKKHTGMTPGQYREE